MNQLIRIAPLYLFIFFFACAIEPASEQQDNGTQAMIQIVKEANARINPMEVPYYFNAQRADYYYQLATQNPDGSGALQNMLLFGYESICAGKNEDAITELEKILPKVEALLPPQPDLLYNVKRLIALAYFRIGEQNNCIDKPNLESCIFPISEKGVYAITSATERSIQLFKELLQMNAKDFESIWMLNLAYMTLGLYPGEVPEEWLLPPRSFQDQARLPRFPDVALKAGFNEIALSGGVAVDDFNNDGLLDLFTSSWGVNDQLRFFINLGNGAFEERTIEAGLEGVSGGLNMTHADYDNDGWTDLLLLRGAWFGKNGTIPNSLLRNNGDGTFTDVTIESGLLSYHPTQAAVWADFNLDGWLDLFIGNESTMGTNDQPCELYLSNGKDPGTGTVTFTNHIDKPGIPEIRGMVKGVAAGDVNNDRYPDLYISYLDRPNRLLLNLKNNPADPHAVGFSDITLQTGVGEPVNSFPCWFWDYDNDGWEDIFVAAFTIQGGTSAAGLAAQHYKGLPTQSQPRLFRNLGNGTFEDVSGKMGFDEPLFAMGSNFGDVNGDGFLDCYIGTGTPSFAGLVPNKLYLNNGGESFADVTTSTGTGHLQKGHAVGFGDFDNDGDEDIFSVMGGAFEGDVFGNSLFLNPIGNNSAWLTLLLEGRKANRSAIGARVLVNVADPNGKIRSVSRSVTTGSSFGGNSLRLEIGLGEASEIKEVYVAWPSQEKAVEVFSGISLNQTVKLVEGSGKPEPLTFKHFNF